MSETTCDVCGRERLDADAWPGDDSKCSRAHCLDCEMRCERAGRLAALARAEEAEADAQLTRLGLRAAVEHAEWLEAERDAALARAEKAEAEFALIGAFVETWERRP